MFRISSVTQRFTLSKIGNSVSPRGFTTANWHFLNIKPDDGSNAHCVSYKNVEWKPFTPGEDRDMEEVCFGTSKSARFDKLELDEIQKWKDLDTFEQSGTKPNLVVKFWLPTLVSFL